MQRASCHVVMPHLHMYVCIHRCPRKVLHEHICTYRYLTNTAEKRKTDAGMQLHTRTHTHTQQQQSDKHVHCICHSCFVFPSCFFHLLSGATWRTRTTWTPLSPGHGFGRRRTFLGSCWPCSRRSFSVRYTTLRTTSAGDGRRHVFGTASRVCSLVLGLVLPGEWRPGLQRREHRAQQGLGKQRGLQC